MCYGVMEMVLTVFVKESIMKRMLLVGVCMGVFCGVVWAEDKKVSTGDAKTDAALVDIQRKRGETATCQARLETVYKVMDQEIEEVSDAFFKAPNLIFLGVSEAGKWVPSMVSDAGMLWTYDAEEKMVTKFNRGRIYRETELEVDAYVPDPLRPFRGVVWESIRLQEPSENGMYVFKADLKPNLLSAQLPDALVWVRLSISKKEGLLHTIRAFDADDNEVVVRQFKDMVVDAKFSDKVFEFVIPSGAHVIDGTGDAILLLRRFAESE